MRIDYKVHIYKMALQATWKTRTTYELEVWERVNGI